MIYEVRNLSQSDSILTELEGEIRVRKIGKRVLISLFFYSQKYTYIFKDLFVDGAGALFFSGVFCGWCARILCSYFSFRVVRLTKRAVNLTTSESVWCGLKPRIKPTVISISWKYANIFI